MSDNTTLIHKVYWNTVWSAIEAIGRHGISFIIGIVLARLLFPSDYGLVGMLSIFIAISQVFIDSGFSNALICKKDINNDDYSTAFVFNLVIGVCCYLLLFNLAPFIADFYEKDILVSLLRILGLNVIFNSLCVVQNARLIIDYKIKIQTKISIICQILTGIGAIIFAYRGFGVWALALQSVSSSALTTILLWISAKWTPSIRFSIKSFRYLWNFGSKMLLVGIISNIYSNIYSVIIGKYFTSAKLGLFNKAQSMSDLYPKLIYSFTNRVSLPTLAKFQEDPNKVKEVFRKYIQTTSFVVFPVIGVLIILAKPLILTLWSDRWVNAIPIFQILCIGSMWTPFNLFSLSVLQAMGRPDITLKLELFNKIIGVIIILLTLPFGLKIFICGRALYCVYEYAINIYSTKYVIKYNIKEQFSDLGGVLIITLASILPSLFIVPMINSMILQLVVGVSISTFLYIGFSILFKIKAIVLLKNVYNQH